MIADEKQSLLGVRSHTFRFAGVDCNTLASMVVLCYTLLAILAPCPACSVGDIGERFALVLPAIATIRPLIDHFFARSASGRRRTCLTPAVIHFASTLSAAKWTMSAFLGIT